MLTHSETGEPVSAHLIGTGYVRRVVFGTPYGVVLADGCVCGGKGWVAWYWFEGRGSCVN